MCEGRFRRFQDAGEAFQEGRHVSAVDKAMQGLHGHRHGPGGRIDLAHGDARHRVGPWVVPRVGERRERDVRQAGQIDQALAVAALGGQRRGRVGRVPGRLDILRKRRKRRIIGGDAVGVQIAAARNVGEGGIDPGKDDGLFVHKAQAKLRDGVHAGHDGVVDVIREATFSRVLGRPEAEQTGDVERKGEGEAGVFPVLEKGEVGLARPGVHVDEVHHNR